MFLVRILSCLIICFLALDNYAQHSLTKMPYPVNTDGYDEICPILSYDEKELFFTRVGSPDFNKTLVENGEDLSKEGTGEGYQRRLREIYSILQGHHVEDPVASTFNQDIWFSKLDGNKVINVFHPPFPLNNALTNSICAQYGKEGGYLVVNEFPKEGGISAGFSVVQKISDDEFSYPQPIKIQNFDKTGAEINANMSADKQYIILAMDNDDSMGDKDLYLSVKGYDGVYAPPINLGRIINSPYREGTPFFSQDKKKLYFSSNRPGGYGGMDIYVCDRLDYTFRKWSTPRLLGRPVNSPFDDSHPYVKRDKNTIIFTSNRDGSSDIFTASLIRDSLEYEIKVNIYVVKGEQRKKTNAIVYWANAYADEFDFFRVRNGEFHYTFYKNYPVEFKAENRGLMSDVVFLDPQELQDKGIREIDIELFMRKGSDRTPQIFKKTFQRDSKSHRPEIKKDIVKVIEKSPTKKENQDKSKEEYIPLDLHSTVVLKNIFFERAKPDVRPESFSSLINLAKTLKRRPDVIIQVEGHTDNVGDKQALIDLSLARANAIRKFLINEGVKPAQVRTKGFGCSRPITNNKTEEQRKRNRRVEIRILKQG